MPFWIFFSKYELKPNVDCDNSFCIKRQAEFLKIQESKKNQPSQEKVIEIAPILHEDNIWGISVVGSSQEEVETAQNHSHQLDKHSSNSETTTNITNTIQVNDDEDLEVLRNQFQSLSK